MFKEKMKEERKFKEKENKIYMFKLISWNTLLILYENNYYY